MRSRAISPDKRILLRLRATGSLGRMGRSENTQADDFFQKGLKMSAVDFQAHWQPDTLSTFSPEPIDQLPWKR